MDLNAEKIELIKLLLEVEDEQTIIQLKTILMDDYDFYKDLPQHVKDGIQQGLDDIEKGNVRSHKEVMAEMKTKFGFK